MFYLEFLIEERELLNLGAGTAKYNYYLFSDHRYEYKKRCGGQHKLCTNLMIS